jgi:hypothetical protein
MADPLGRKHTTIHKPKNRHHVDSICDHILTHEKTDFHHGKRKPSAQHVYFDAFAVMYGVEEACKMLDEARTKWEKS